MAFLSLTGFISILIVLHALWDSSAHAADQQGRKMQGNIMMVRKEKVSPALVTEKHAGLGGRKLLTKKLVDVSLGSGLKEEENTMKSENAKNADLDESNRVVEANNSDIAQPGHGDYSAGRIKSRCKPPINNHKEPTD